MITILPTVEKTFNVEGKPVPCVVTTRVDLDKLATTLGRKAARNKNGRATAHSRALIVTVDPR